MADTPFKTTDRDGAQVNLPTAQLVADAVATLQGALVPLLDNVETLLAATPLPTGAATQATLEAVRLLLAGTVAISAAALPLPAGAATSALQTALNALVTTTAPADDALAIVPNDGADLATTPKALLVTAAGTLSIRGVGGTTVSLGNVSVGQVIPIRARRVMTTGTTATVVGLV